MVLEGDSPETSDAEVNNDDDDDDDDDRGDPSS